VREWAVSSPPPEVGATAVARDHDNDAS
jgi:hypothetical protein